MGFIDFIRGKYPEQEPEKLEAISVLFGEMTHREKTKLLTKTFDEIWKEIWNNHDSKCFKNEYDLAKKKYINLDIPELVRKSSTTYVFQEFGFPKGRRNMKETNIACAEREFFEETGYDKDCYDFIKNYPIIKEEFVGTNNVEYRHIYYLVKIKDRVPPPKIDIYNKVQTGEVRNIGWFTLDECLQLIRPYDIAKKNMIKSVATDIENMNAQYNCSKIFFASSSRREEIFSSVDIYNTLCEEYLTGENYLIDTNY
jgi:8-oxo-dGTP pyrophosphatase MutT (NUDIX family)